VEGQFLEFGVVEEGGGGGVEGEGFAVGADGRIGGEEAADAVGGASGAFVERGDDVEDAHGREEARGTVLG